MDGLGWDWDGWMDLRVGGGIEHLTVLIMNSGGLGKMGNNCSFVY